MGSFLGIDYDSNKIHTVYIDEDTGRLTERQEFQLAAKGADAFDRARLVRDVLPSRRAWLDAGVIAVGIETPFSIYKGAAVAYARVEGAILACLPTTVPVIPIGPVEWKRATLGEGKTQAKKPAVRAWAEANGCPPGLDQDFCDAFSIAHAARIEWQRRAGAA